MKAASPRLPYIGSIDEWHRLIAEKRDERDLVVFKVSHLCGMSFMADQQVEEWIAGVDTPLGVDIYKVDVHSGRPISNLIEEEFGIRHESPQILWIGEGGRVRWHGSHRAITREQMATLYADRPGG